MFLSGHNNNKIMILNNSGQILHSKLIGKPESEAQHQMRCYHTISTN